MVSGRILHYWRGGGVGEKRKPWDWENEEEGCPFHIFRENCR